MGLVHGFGQKLEISSLFIFRQIWPKKLFGNVLYNKLAFLDHKKHQFRIVAKFAFFQRGLVHGFCQIFEISSTFLFRQIWPKKCFVTF